MLIYLSAIESDSHKSKFEAIYTEYRNLMFYIANRILKHVNDSEDVVHQSFLKIIEIIDKIGDPKCPQTKSLVVTIVERKAIDLYRARKRRKILPIDEEYINVPSRSEIETLPERSAFAEAMAMLPTRYRELLMLKYDNGFTNHEIAGMLSMTEDNVKKTLQRAKAKLEMILEEQEASTYAGH